MPSKDNSPLSSIGVIIKLSFTIITPILGGVFLGNYLDSRFYKGNLFLIIFTILGGVTAFILLLVESSKLSRKE